MRKDILSLLRFLGVFALLSLCGSGILYMMVSLRGFAKQSRRDGFVADSSP